MDSIENFHERFEALEQQMKVMGSHTRTHKRERAIGPHLLYLFE
jgi:hypothetical protein